MAADLRGFAVAANLAATFADRQTVGLLG